MFPARCNIKYKFRELRGDSNHLQVTDFFFFFFVKVQFYNIPGNRSILFLLFFPQNCDVILIEFSCLMIVNRFVWMMGGRGGTPPDN